jgi:dihydrolipoamide dehydrogenase
MGRLLERALVKQGIKFRLETSAAGAKPAGDALKVTLESKGERSEIDADVVLVAIGRRPHTEGLGARELGVAFDDKGRITVNERFETSVRGVFAIGDVIPGPMLAHKAEEEAVACVELMNGQAGHVAYEAIPNVVYTWPELASVGLSEEDAKARGREIATGTFPFTANARARCLGETDGSVKVVADKATDRVLGVHIVGPRASDLIAEAALAVEFGASAEDIARTVHAHPTLPEALKEAALGVAKRQINI